MGITDRASAAWNAFWGTRQSAAPVKSSGGTGKVAQIVVNAGRTASFGMDANLDYFMRLAIANPWFFSALRIISDRLTNVAKLSMQEKRNGKWVTIEEHPFNSLLARPNALMPGGLMMGSTSEWLDAAGNGYWFLVTDRPGRGNIQEMWLLPADRIEPDPRTARISPFTGQVVIDYRYSMGTQIMLPGENIVHFRTPNLFDFWRGTSSLSALQHTLQTDANQASWLGSYFGEDNAVPTAVISLPPDIDDAEFDAVKRDITDQFGAQRRAAITRAGDMSVEVIQHTIDEMKVIDGMQFNAEAIRAVLHVPKLGDFTSGASRLAADMALMRDAIQPKLDLIAAFVTLKICPFYERQPGTLRCIAENVVPQDDAVEATKYKTYAPDRTLNENREAQKLKPLHLPDELESYQVLFDSVPERYVDMFVQLLEANQTGQAGQLGANGVEISAQLPNRKQLIAQMTGKQLPAHRGVNRNAIMRQMAGHRPAQPQGEMGVRVSGQPTQRQLLRQLTGVSTG